MSPLSPNIIGQIALMQSVVVQLPTTKGIFDFVCRGLEDIPGVISVEYDLKESDSTKLNSEEFRIYSISNNSAVFAHIIVTLHNFNEFIIYEPYIKNFCVILALVLEERRQRDENRQLMNNLEQLVQERTDELNTYKNELEHLVLKRTEELEKTLSDLRSTQEKLIETKKLASLTNIVTGIAHELNTPLGVIITASTYLRDMIENIRADFVNHKLTKKKFNGYLDNMRETDLVVINNSNIAKDLIMGFKNIIVDKSDEERREVHLERLLGSYITELEDNLENITINIICHSDIIIYSYPDALSQVFSNLIINSIKHGFLGKNSGKIHIELTYDNSRVKIFYRDDGNGIDESFIDNIFDPFYTTKMGDGRSGLGLFIVYSIVNQTLNGSISLKNSESGGIEFEIEFPDG